MIFLFLQEFAGHSVLRIILVFCWLLWYIFIPCNWKLSSQTPLWAVNYSLSSQLFKKLIIFFWAFNKMSGFTWVFKLLDSDGEAFRSGKLIHILLSGSLNKIFDNSCAVCMIIKRKKCYPVFIFSSTPWKRYQVVNKSK